MHWHCPIKTITGVPCPGCGTTRAVWELLHGNIYSALWTNPLGIILFLTICAYALCIIIDWSLGSNSRKILFERPFLILKEHRFIYYLVIVLCTIVAVLNAYWNYCKGL